MSRRDVYVTALLLALALNSAYLAARADPNLFYFANVALHVALGIASAALVSRLARSAWPSLGGAWRAAAALFASGSLLGLVLLVTGATRPYRVLLYAHCRADRPRGARGPRRRRAAHARVLFAC